MRHAEMGSAQFNHMGDGAGSKEQATEGRAEDGGPRTEDGERDRDGGSANGSLCSLLLAARSLFQPAAGAA